MKQMQRKAPGAEGFLRQEQLATASWSLNPSIRLSELVAQTRGTYGPGPTNTATGSAKKLKDKNISWSLLKPVKEKEISKERVNKG